MLAVRAAAGGPVEVVEVPDPEAATEDEVVVTVTSAGICGSDLHMLPGGFSVTPGHEVAGLLDDGTAVAIRPYVSCLSCRTCRRGRAHLCRTAGGSFYGMVRPGGMAERMVVERSMLVPLPDGLDPASAALVEPMGVVLHGLHSLGVLAGSRVLVIGGGTIGLLSAAGARALGADVDLAARHPAQIDAGIALGAGTGVERGYDVVVDAVGTQTALDQAVGAVTPGGTILELGVPWGGVQVPLAMALKEVDYRPAMLYATHDGESELAIAARMLAAHPSWTDVVITHRFPLDRAPEAWAAAADRASGALKVHLTP